MQKICFNDRYGLTQAVLNGTKTMTRRVIQQKVMDYALNDYRQKYYEAALDYLENDFDCLVGYLLVEKHTRYKRNEVVAVAQSYKDAGYNGKEKYGYCYDENEEAVDVLFEEVKGWNNKLFVKPSKMPRQIQITDVRIEKLQAISYEDCIKEGVIEHMDSRGYCYYYVKGMDGWFHSPREAFAALINRPGVGRKGLWEENPWVVVYEFKVIK